MRLHSIILLVILIAFVLTIAATSSLVDSKKQVTIGDFAPLFEVKTVHGSDLSLFDYRGKYVLLEFWATWCGPCTAETPNLKAVHKAFGHRNDFVMIGLSLDKDTKAPIEYARENEIEWIIGFLGDWSKDRVTKAYGVAGIPQIMLIDPNGRVVARLRGPSMKDQVAHHLGDDK